MNNKSSQGYGSQCIRGTLTKEIYESEKQELERKRRQMKQILDRQVEQRRRQKEIEKKESQKMSQLEDQKIKAYYMHLENREKFSTSAGGKKLNINEEKLKSEKEKKNSRYTEKTIPVIAVMENNQSISRKKSRGKDFKIKQKKIQHNSVSHLPLLEISPEEDRNIQPDRKISIKHKSSGKKIELNKKKSIKEEKMSEKGSTDEVNVQLEFQNNELKEELRKNQEALSFLLKAVNTNKAMEKYKRKAQKILYGNKIERDQPSIRQKLEEKDEAMLPSLKVHHQSMMHDYMFGCARKASLKKISK